MKIVKPDLSGLWTKICVEDDLKSFEALYRALGAKLLKFSVYYVGQKEVAEEIVSEVFVKCWQNRKENGHILNPETYLFVAVKNQSLKHLRKYANVHLLEINGQQESEFQDSTDPSKELERKELHQKLDTAIDTLPPQARIVFRLIKENGMKYKEVAEILKISPRTVQTQLFRAMTKLRILLGAYHKLDHRKTSSNDLVNLLMLLGIIHYFLNLL